VRGQVVHLDVVVEHLAHQPPGVGPLPAQVARGPGGQVVAVARGAQLVEGVADLGVRVGDGDGRALGGEHQRQQGHHERGVPFVQQVEHGVLEGPDRSQVGPLGTCDHRRTA
jgi:hypothetical protein